MSILKRHNVNVFGRGPKTIMFAHGYGCNQNMWRYIVPAFQADYRIVLFDVVGNGDSDSSSYTPERYNSLDAYADDILEIAGDLQLRNAIFVGHSVSSMTGLLASIKEPSRFSHLVMIGPSPRYINSENYMGGFEKANIEDFLTSIANDYTSWANSLAPVVMGNAERPELTAELQQSFAKVRPDIAKNYARVTFMSDNREHLHKLKAKTLILQATEDIIAPLAVGEYLKQHIAQSQLVIMKATGHYPSLSAPQETIAEIKAFLQRPAEL